jgi:hypothetical protein
MPSHAREGAAVVSVQHQWSTDAGFSEDRFPDKGGRELSPLTVLDFPAHNLAAEDIYDEVQLEKHARH